MLIAILVCWVFEASAQLPTHAWRSHLPMSRFTWVGELENLFLGANRYAVIVYDKQEGSISSLTKINALTQTDLSAFACSKEDGLCIVGYENGNIDIITSDQEVINQPAIVNSNVIGDKGVFDIDFEDGKAIVSSGIGVLELDLNSFNVNAYSKVRFDGETKAVKHMITFGEEVFLAVDEAVLRGGRAELFDDPSFVSVEGTLNPDRLTELFAFQGALYAIYSSSELGGDTLLKWSGNQFERLSQLAGMELSYVDVSEDKLLFSHRYTVVEYDASFSEQRRIFTYSVQPGMDANQVIYTSDHSRVLIGDEFYGLVNTSLDDQYNSILVGRSSPKTGLIGELEVSNGVVYAMPGGNDFTFNAPYLFSLSDEIWSSQLLYSVNGATQRNTSCVAATNEFTYVGFDGAGLMILDSEGAEVASFEEENAEIEDDKDGYYGLKGLALDDEGNLWMLNSRATSTLSVLDPEGNWTLISLPGYPKPIADNFTRLSSGVFAFSLKENGVILYDPADTPTFTDDDRFVSITASPTNGNLPNNTVNCLVEDRDGELWIGTDEGIGVLYSPTSMFTNSPENVQRIIVNQDGYNGYLFEADAVMSIAVDGANRKWVAPRGGGLFLISADGQDQLIRFTKDDSPLLNDNVSDVAIHPESGEVFIATEGGLQSYRADASEPASQLAQIKVFPNPVKPGYGGWITLTGLTEGSYVRVTDTGGNLVFETQSQGGTAVWDGKDRSGQRVVSGVYLIFAADRSGAGGSITKLLFLH
jgi:hypothetical protein